MHIFFDLYIRFVYLVGSMVSAAALLALAGMDLHKTVFEFNFHFELTLAPEAAIERDGVATLALVTETDWCIRGIEPLKWMMSVLQVDQLDRQDGEGVRKKASTVEDCTQDRGLESLCITGKRAERCKDIIELV